MIVTDWLLSRPMRDDDTETPLAIFSDPRVMASFGGELFDRDDMTRWMRRTLDHQTEYGYGSFSIIHPACGALIGDRGLEWTVIGGTAVAELGYDFHGDLWSQGLATEAAMAVRDVAFRDLGLPRIISLIRHGNVTSKRVAEGRPTSRLRCRSLGPAYWLSDLTGSDSFTDEWRSSRSGPGCHFPTAPKSLVRHSVYPSYRLGHRESHDSQDARSIDAPRPHGVRQGRVVSMGTPSP